MKKISTSVVNYDPPSAGFSEGKFRDNPGDDTGSKATVKIVNDLYYGFTALIKKYLGSLSDIDESESNSDVIDSVEEMASIVGPQLHQESYNYPVGSVILYGSIFYRANRTIDTGADGTTFILQQSAGAWTRVDSVVKSEVDLKIAKPASPSTDDYLRYNGSEWINYPLAVNTGNSIIDGNFNIWWEGISQTSSGYGSDTMWRNEHSGSTKTHSRQSFVLGQTDVPGEPTYFSRTVVSSSIGAANYVRKTQRMESVRKHAGKTVTISFYAKADAVKDIAIELVQNFGTGGTPSPQVTAIGVTKKTLSTTFEKYSLTVSIPSISGKSLGTNDDDYLELVIWFDAGTSYDGRTGTLGQQSGTFDMSQVKLEDGTVATSFEYEDQSVLREHVNRYYIKSYPESMVPGTADTLHYLILYVGTNSTSSIGFSIQHPSMMRSTSRILTLYNPVTGVSGQISRGGVAASSNFTRLYHQGFQFYNTNAISASTISLHFTDDARL